MAPFWAPGQPWVLLLRWRSEELVQLAAARKRKRKPLMCGSPPPMELIFWAVAFPTEIFIYLQTAGHWFDFSKPEESAAVFGMVFAASNIARLLLPLRFGAALAMAPWVDENIMQRFSEPQATDSATTTAVPVAVPVPVSNAPIEKNENELRAYLMQN